MSDPQNSKNALGVFEPFPIDQVPWETASKGNRFGMAYQYLTGYGGGSQIAVANEVLQPGQQANPLHYHLLEEEHIFMLEGALTVRLGDTSYILNVGHYVCFPAGQAVGHALINHSDTPCRYLIIGNPQPHDVAVFPETGRVSVKLMGEGYSNKATLEYWEGVDVGSLEKDKT